MKQGIKFKLFTKLVKMFLAPKNDEEEAKEVDVLLIKKDRKGRTLLEE